MTPAQRLLRDAVNRADRSRQNLAWRAERTEADAASAERPIHGDRPSFLQLVSALWGAEDELAERQHPPDPDRQFRTKRG